MTTGPTADQELKKSLYDRLGGELAVDTLTMAFYTNVNADERLKHYFENIDLMQQINHQKRFLTFALGGAEKYDGNELSAAHKRFNLNTEDFAAFNDVLRMTLNDLDVEKDISEEILAITKQTGQKMLEYGKKTV